MDRRMFLEAAGKGSLGLMLSSRLTAASDTATLTAQDVNDHLRSLCEVAEPSVDRIVIGRPETGVTGIGTAWMPYWQTLREAVKRGVNTLVVHEPTFYAHWDLDTKDSDFFGGQPGRDDYVRLRDEKIKWINDNGLVIIRCHDVLDKVAGFGIPFALGQVLGFTDDDLIRSKTFFNVYRVEPKPAALVAREIASRLKVLGQPGVAFYGDPDYRVRSVGVGTGCICDPIGFADLKPDLFIGIDDTIRTWIQTTYAEDTGRPLVVINHGTSEEYGMRMLNGHLKEVFPNKNVVHLNQGCSYRWITA